MTEAIVVKLLFALGSATAKLEHHAAINLAAEHLVCFTYRVRHAHPYRTHIITTTIERWLRKASSSKIFVFVWLDLPRGRRGSAGDSAASTVGAHE
ncbi:MAG: hypothetical protein ACLPSH_04855 [Vulcanimicrobiaceae bacterium]|jgi:hypothetical protein